MAKVINDDSGLPDLGREASSGFPSQVYPGSRPYERYNRRGKAVDGGGFQTAVGNEQVVRKNSTQDISEGKVNQ
jgi:hypothetical protein